MKLKTSARWMGQILEWTVSDPAILNVFFFLLLKVFPCRLSASQLKNHFCTRFILQFAGNHLSWKENICHHVFSPYISYFELLFFFPLTTSAQRAIRRLMNCNTAPANKWFPFFFCTNHQRSGGWLFCARLKEKLNGRQADVAFS